MRVAEREEHAELLAEGAVEALAAALHLDGAEAGGGEAGEVHGAEAALADDAGREARRDGLDLGPREPPGLPAAALAGRRGGRRAGARLVRDAGVQPGRLAAEAREQPAPVQHFSRRVPVPLAAGSEGEAGGAVGVGARSPGEAELPRGVGVGAPFWPCSGGQITERLPAPAGVIYDGRRGWTSTNQCAGGRRA